MSSASAENGEGPISESPEINDGMSLETESELKEKEKEETDVENGHELSLELENIKEKEKEKEKEQEDQMNDEETMDRQVVLTPSRRLRTYRLSILSS
jgi:hypothetical protein